MWVALEIVTFVKNVQVQVQVINVLIICYYYVVHIQIE